MSKILRTVGALFGIFIIANIVLEILVSYFVLNFVIYMIIGLIFLFYSLFYTKISIFCKSNILRFFKYICNVGLIFFAVTFTITTAVIYEKSMERPTEKSDAIIVLGAGLAGELVTMPLALRLNSAAEYYFENPEAVIVVSGGQGPTELVTEAYAMKKYLVNKGIPEDKIIEEGLSTRTIENFQFSKYILDDYFGHEDYSVVYVSNGTHVFRSGLIAQTIGLEVESIGALNTPFLAVNQYLYEYFALIKFVLLDYI